MNAVCQNISLHQLKQKLFSQDEVTILDVREIEEYRNGHIEGSTLVPLGILPHRLDSLNKEEEIICVCRSGNRSQQACDILLSHGFENVASLSGGLSNWSA